MKMVTSLQKNRVHPANYYITNNNITVSLILFGQTRNIKEKSPMIHNLSLTNLTITAAFSLCQIQLKQSNFKLEEFKFKCLTVVSNSHYLNGKKSIPTIYFWNKILLFPASCQTHSHNQLCNNRIYWYKTTD